MTTQHLDRPAMPPADWYPDPVGRHEYRFYDGAHWTGHVADDGRVQLDPLSPAPPLEPTLLTPANEAPAPQPERPITVSPRSEQPAGVEQPAEEPLILALEAPWPESVPSTQESLLQAGPARTVEPQLPHRPAAASTEAATAAPQAVPQPAPAAPPPSALRTTPLVMPPATERDRAVLPSGSQASWQPDPTRRHQYRYFDGATWTDHVADHGQPTKDPYTLPPPPPGPPAPVRTQTHVRRVNRLDIGRSFSMPFKDPDWPKKMALGGLWVLFIVTGPAALGAMLAYIRSVAQGNETLPDWGDFGAKWLAGFLVSVGLFMYSIPVYLAPWISSVALDARLEGIAWFVLLVAAMWSIAVAVFAYGAVTNYAIKGYFDNLFEYAEITRAIRSRSGYLGALGMTLVIAFSLSVITGILLLISDLLGGGLYLTVIGLILLPWLIFASWMIMGHMFGQYAAKAYGMPGLGAVPSSLPGSVGYPPPDTPPSPAQPPCEPGTYPEWEEVSKDLARLPEGLLSQLAKAMVFIVREDGREHAAVIVRADASEFHSEVTPSTPMRLHVDFYAGSHGDVFGIYPLVLDADRPAFKETWLHPYDDTPEVQSTDPLAAEGRKRLRLLLRQQYAWTIFVGWNDEILWVRKVEFTNEQVQSLREYDAMLDRYVGQRLEKMQYFALLQEYLRAVTTEDLNAEFLKLFRQPAFGAG